MSVESIITENLDIWTSAIKTKSASGRGSSKKLEFYGIKKLRELILELAVSGKLVSQKENEESASELLKSILDEKKILISQKRLKKSRKLAELTVQDLPFKLPESWQWVRLGDISTANTGYAFKSSQYQEKGMFVLRVTNIEDSGKINKYDAKFIDERIAIDDFSQFSLVENDVLLVMVGGSLGKIGKVTSDILPAVLNQNMWKFERYGSMSSDYLMLGLKYINKNLINITSSTHGHLSQGDYLSKPFPLPPLCEQERIVKKFPGVFIGPKICIVQASGFRWQQTESLRQS